MNRVLQQRVGGARRVSELATDKASWGSPKEKCYAYIFLTLLSRMHESCILIHVRTTLNINDDLLKQAARLSGITEKTAIVHAGLEALVARESAKRLAALGGSEPRLRKIRRRRPQGRMASR